QRAARPHLPAFAEPANLGCGFALRALDAGVLGPVVVEPPAERFAVEALGLFEVGDRELHVVDGMVSVRRWLRHVLHCARRARHRALTASSCRGAATARLGGGRTVTGSGADTVWRCRPDPARTIRG